MTDDLTARLPSGPSYLQQVQALFLRVVALASLVQGLAYWVRLLGMYDGAAWRFDLMPLYWQVTSIPLAVLFPFAAVGLWMLASWGPVIWFLCAMTEIFMYGFFPHLYGNKFWLIALHLVVAIIYVALRLAAFSGRARKRD